MKSNNNRSQKVIVLAILLSLNVATVTSFSSHHFRYSHEKQHSHQLSSSATVTLDPGAVLIEKPSWIDNNDGSNNNVVVTKKQVSQHKKLSQNVKISIEATNAATRQKGGISMTVKELAKVFGGDTNKAQLVWDCYSIGVDPTKLYGKMVDLGYDDFESINKSLPKTSTSCSVFSNSLGSQVLDKLSSLYPPSSKGKVENGVAELLKICNEQNDETKIQLKLFDGTKVNTYIVPSKDSTTSSTLIINTKVLSDSNNEQGNTSGRSLSSDEILSQMFYGRKVCRWEKLPEISSVIVYTGNSDARENTEAILDATRILKSSDTFSLSDPSKVQLSIGVFDS